VQPARVVILSLYSLFAKDVVDLGHHSCFELPANASVDLRGANWNYKCTKSNGSRAHYNKHTLYFLELNLEKLDQ
jgi:hypothetical protein